MAKIKPERAYAKEIFDGFSGIGSDMAVDGKHAADIRNFRILPDGSLQKRCGWENYRSFVDPVRAYWEGSLNGTSYSFAVAGDHVYRITGNNSIRVGTLSSPVGKLSFLAFREKLFLLGGCTVLSYHASSDSFIEAEGYAPLIGYNWHPTELGELHEPVNLLSKHVRVHYFNTTGSDVFYLPFYPQSIDEVRVNGSKTSSYTFSDTVRYVTVPSAAAAASVEIAFTMKAADDMFDRITSCNCAFLQQNEDRTILALYGSAYPNLLFCASPVSEQMMNASTAVYPNTDALYFTQSGLLTLGDRDHPLTSLYYHMGRVLAFHSGGAYAIYFSNEGGIEYYPILTGMGCSAIDAALYLDGDPVVVNAGGIFRLHATVSEPDVFEVSCISSAIPKLSGEAFAGSVTVFHNRADRELWFSSPLVDSGRVWVWQIDRGEWVSFDNIFPTFFFSCSCSVAFASGTYLRFFNESRTTDNGSPIVAYYTTPYLTFSYPERVKRAMRVTVCSHSTQHRLQVNVLTESKTRTLSMTHAAANAPVLLDTRVPLGRFKLAQVRLCDQTTARTRIFRLALFANL